MTETDVQNAIRVRASQMGWRLWRNNCGALPGPNGRPIRFGLGNDSKATSEHIKSADLCGIIPVVITQAMVGQTIGQFCSIEVKHAGWVFSGTPREIAQYRWMELIKSLGGYAKIVTNENEI